MAKGGQKSAWDTRIEPRLKEIGGWCREGLTNKQIAEILGVGESTFLRYKALKEELRESLKINKNIADLRIIDTLYQRAIGFEYKEEVQELFIDGKKVKNIEDIKKIKPEMISAIKIKKYKKFIPPDVTAQIFWLKNRQPEKWRDKHIFDNNINHKVKIEKIERVIVDPDPQEIEHKSNSPVIIEFNDSDQY